MIVSWWRRLKQWPSRIRQAYILLTFARISLTPRRRMALSFAYPILLLYTICHPIGQAFGLELSLCLLGHGCRYLRQPLVMSKRLVLPSKLPMSGGVSGVALLPK
jgi:hypothetical protein